MRSARIIHFPEQAAYDWHAEERRRELERMQKSLSPIWVLISGLMWGAGVWVFVQILKYFR